MSPALLLNIPQTHSQHTDVGAAGAEWEWDFSFLPTDEAPPAVETEADMLELKRGNLLLERQKLTLEIQILQAKMEKLNRGNN